MKKRTSLAFCLLLAGCTDTDWDRALNYGGAEDVAQAQPAAQAPETASAAPVAPTEPTNAAFCRSVATQDASSNGFDRATQTSVYARSYAQCLAIYTR